MNRNNYSWAINIDQINDYIDSNNTSSVNKIQEVKQSIVKKILSTINIDSKEFKEAFSSYLNDLEEKNWKKNFKKDKILKEYKLLIDWLYNSNLEFEESYIWNFSILRDFLFKYWNTHYLDLLNDLKNKKVPKREEENLSYYLSRINNKNKYPNSPSREVFFDEDSFYIETENWFDSKNAKCFYEQDQSWNKNYFSLNDLLSYIDTFWWEIWLPIVDVETIPEDIRKTHFPSINRKIKYHMYKWLIRDLRDKQEVIMYWFTDYENTFWQDNSMKSWFIAEKIVELEFRRSALDSWYDIKIEKWSIWEDQEFKVDLFIVLQDKKTWFSIKEEIQITIRDDISLKQIQIDKRNKYLKEIWDNHTESELVKFMLNNLSTKLQFWRSFNRPIWKISEVLDYAEQKTITSTFERLSKKMQDKKERMA